MKSSKNGSLVNIVRVKITAKNSITKKGESKMKKLLSILLTLALTLSMTACKANTDNKNGIKPDSSVTDVTASGQEASDTTQAPPVEGTYKDPSLSTAERVEDLLSQMTLEEKAGQMMQGTRSSVSSTDVKSLGLGSVLSGGGDVPGISVDDWQGMYDTYQEAAMSTRLQIPFIYGIDAVHGHSNVYGAVIFPQNIGLGAANDPDLMYRMGEAVAEEMKLSHTMWNFSPCVAVAQDPRWGRTYESFSSDPEIVSSLALSYLHGMMDHGILATAKHYAGDGATDFGTGEGDNLIDRGDVTVSMEEFRATHLAPYKVLIDGGLQVIMASFSSYMGEKMTENKYYLTDVLKDEFGFRGFIVTDWEATLGLSGDSFEQNVANAINAGADMLMEPNNFEAAIDAIVSGVEEGRIPMERIDDAVSRILTVKFNMGLFEDPFLENMEIEVDAFGSQEYRDYAKELVSESLVLLKNEGNVLPLQAGQKIFVTGPAIDDMGVQCGGWTVTWQGSVDQGGNWTEGTTILEGLQEYADANGMEIITDEARANEADVVILAVGEIPYAEFMGDTANMTLTGDKALPDNQEAIEFAAGLNIPIITLIVAGRQVEIDDYFAGWDSVVMCYLPGTEGDGIASVLVGETPFSGKLPMPWYKDVNEIGTGNIDLMFDLGYGLSY
jgi:beta-glucosidase